MSAHAWRRRRAKVLLRDPAVRQWFAECGDRLASELAKYHGDSVMLGPQLSWRLMMDGLPVYTPKEIP